MTDYKEIPNNIEMQKLLDELLTRHPNIVQTPECMGGQPRIESHRMRVVDFLGTICGNDYSPSKMVEQWKASDPNTFTVEDVQSALSYALDMVDLVWCKANGQDYEDEYE